MKNTMKDWHKISILLCVFGFLKEMRPLDPFVYEYLIGPHWNMTEEQVIQEVFPVSIYGYLVQLVIVFLITDLCRYKPLIIVLGLAGIMTWSMLIWSSTLLELQILEVSYGTVTAAEVAYYTYIYVKVPKEHYTQVTAHTRAAVLGGRCLSAVLAQLLLEFNVLDYRGLNYINFSSMIAATLWSLLLPSVPKSIYFHQDPEKEKLDSKGKYRNAFALMKTHFVKSFSNGYVARWSVWWALATAGYNQVQAYIQALWSEIHTDSSLHNGTVEALLTLVGCLGALSTAFLKIDWNRRGELVLAICSILGGTLVIISSQATHIVVSYACYVMFGGLYHFVIAIVAGEVAKYILEDSYGLVFGFNTLIALIIQTLATVFLVSGDVVWALSPRDQHVAYGVYHMGIAVIFIVIGAVNWFKGRKSTVNES